MEGGGGGGREGGIRGREGGGRREGGTDGLRDSTPDRTTEAKLCSLLLYSGCKSQVVSWNEWYAIPHIPNAVTYSLRDCFFSWNSVF